MDQLLIGWFSSYKTFNGKGIYMLNGEIKNQGIFNK